MNSTWQSLFWKEWREQRAIALAILFVLLVIPPLTTLVELGDLYAGLAGTLLFGMPFFALFVGVGIAAGEQSRGTISFLRALPMPSWRAALVKLIVAIASLTIPIVIAVVSYYLYNLVRQHLGDARVVGTGFERDLLPPVWGISNYFLTAGVSSCLMAVSIVCWTAAAGANRRDEVSAGAMAGVTIAGAYLTMGIGAWLAWKISRDLFDLILPLLAAFPGAPGWISAEQLHGPWNLTVYLLAAAVFAMLSHAAIAWWFVTRYGQVAAATGALTPTNANPAKNRTTSAKRAWLNAPRRSIFTALVWKQFRELFAIVAVGIAVIVSIILVGVLMNLSNGDGLNAREWLELPYGAWVMIGGMIAIVIGVGVFLEDLKPGIYNFWRSRPTPFDLWFWTKFAIGWLACLAPVWIPLLAFGLQAILFEGIDDSDPGYQPWQQFAFGLSAHTGLYCSAVLTMSVLRRPILAAVFAPAALLGTLVLLGKIAEWADIREPGVFGFGAIALTLCAAAAILAWQAIRRNWSLERFMT